MRPWNQKFIIGLVLTWMIGIAGRVQAAPVLQVLVGMHKPPYIQVDSADGYEIELLRQVVNRMGYQPEFTYVPNKRIQSLLSQGIGDIATLQPVVGAEPGIYYSCPYIRYQNVVLTLHADKLQVQNAADLAHLRVVAFQNAGQVLSEEYQQMARDSLSYRETVDQRTQVEMLQKKRVQALVMDLNIFNYYFDRTEPIQQVSIHPIFKPTFYRVGFRVPQLAFGFNQALREFMLDPAYQQLQERYFVTMQYNLPKECKE